MEPWVVAIIAVVAVITIAVILTTSRISKLRKARKYERSLEMKPLLIHLPPTTADISSSSGRDERDIANEAISKAQIMYSILSSTIEKGLKTRLYGQKHFVFEIVAKNGFIRYYAIVPAALTEVVKQAVQSSYPTARIEEKDEDNIFEGSQDTNTISGAELSLAKDYYLPIATYEDTKRDASMAILNALSNLNKSEGAAVQILFRPAEKNWSESGKQRIESIQSGKKTKTVGAGIGQTVIDIIRAPFEVPEMHEKHEETVQISNIKQDEITAISSKMRYPAFETLIRIIASSDNKPRSDAIVGSLVSAFSQFDSPELNGFEVNMFKDPKKLCVDYTFCFFPLKTKNNILNSVELASIFHLPEQNAIPTSSVERQLVKQVDGPAKLMTEGLFFCTPKFISTKK